MAKLLTHTGKKVVLCISAKNNVNPEHRVNTTVNAVFRTPIARSLFCSQPIDDLKTNRTTTNRERGREGERERGREGERERGREGERR